jgi:hypothetical protein
LSINADGSKTEKEFLPGRFFVCLEPSYLKNQINTTGKEKEHNSMYSLIQVKTLLCGRDPARSLPLGRGFLLIPLILVCFALHVQAAPNALPAPTPDGCYPGFTTAEGCNALKNLTTGAGNTGVGWFSLFFAGASNFNTGLGGGALVLNTGDSNTATGAAALLLNGAGTRNTANGTDALVFNATGDFNDAVGAFALFNNTDGFSNNAVGDSALFANIHGAGNTAVGDLALQNNDLSGAATANLNTAVGAEALFGAAAGMDGDSNNAVGFQALTVNGAGGFNEAMGVLALGANVDGAANVAVGDTALGGNAHGSFNTIVGDQAGATLEGDDNIYIGATSGSGVTSESGTIRIGDPTFVSACFVAGIFGQTATGGLPVVVDANGKLGTVPAGVSMNELLEDHCVVQELKATAEKQQATIALLTATLREQATQIQKVSAQIEMIRPAPQMVENR